MSSYVDAQEARPSLEAEEEAAVEEGVAVREKLKEAEE